MVETNPGQFRELYNNIDNYKKKFAKSFAKHSNDDGVLDPDQIGAVLDDWSTTLGVDLEAAKTWLDRESNNVPEDIDYDNLGFDDFFRAFKLYLEYEDLKEQERQGEENEQEDEEGQQNENENEDENENNNSRGGEEEEQRSGGEDAEQQPEDEGQEEEEAPRESKSKSDVSKNQSKNSKKTTSIKESNLLPPKYKINKRKLDNYVNKNKLRIEGAFRKRIIEDDVIENQDLFNFLTDAFSIDGVDRAIILEREHDNKEFLKSAHARKKLDELVHDYLINRREMNEGDFDMKDVLLTFTDCFDVLDYWFSIDHDVTVVQESEFSQKQDTKQQVRDTLLETIGKYEQILQDCKSEIEKKVIIRTIDSLKEQLAELDREDGGAIMSHREKGAKRTEKRLKALREMYNFYCKQHCKVGVYTTFDNIKKELDVLSLGEFSFIVRDFQLLKNRQDKTKTAEIFKKCSATNKELTFDEFQKALERLAVIYYTADHNYRNDADRIDAFYEYMGLYNGTYKSKMRNVNIAFHTMEKEAFRIPKESAGYRFKVRPNHGKSTAEIHEELRRRKEQKMAEKQGGDTSIVSGVQRPLHQYDLKKNDSETSYIGINHKKMLYNINQPEKNKFSIEKLEKMHYDDVKNLDENFNPHDLIEENDEEDNIYLAEYNLGHEKQLKEQSKNQEIKRLQEYGNVKKLPPKYPEYKSPVPGAKPNYSIVSSSVDSQKGLLHQSKKMGRTPSNENFTRMQYGSDQSNLHYFDPEPASRGEQMKNVIMERASQIDNQNKKREEELAKNFYARQDNKVQKGISKYSKY